MCFAQNEGGHVTIREPNFTYRIPLISVQGVADTLGPGFLMQIKEVGFCVFQIS